MNRKVWLTVLLFTCFLSAISLTQFMVSVRASPHTHVNVSQAKAMIDSNPDLVILDVRWWYEYKDGHLRNAILIPKDELAGRLDELDNETDTLVYCAAGVRSDQACVILDNAGFTSVYNMDGGITAWKNAGYPIEIVFNATWEEGTYPVATFSNSTITSFNFNQPLKQISFNVAGTDDTTGFCNVTIPIVLLDGNFTVLINEMEIGYTLTRSATHSFVYFSYSHTTKQVKIVGTTVIGEVPEVSPVGGIYIPVNKLQLLAPYIGLTILLAVAVVTVGYVKKRKRDTS